MWVFIRFSCEGVLVILPKIGLMKGISSCFWEANILYDLDF